MNDLAHDQADYNSHNNQIGKAQEPRADGWCLTSNQQRNAKFKRQQSAGIVQQALAFKNIDDALWQPNALSNRGRGNGVSGCNYGAKNQSYSPIKSGNNP